MVNYKVNGREYYYYSAIGRIYRDRESILFIIYGLLDNNVCYKI